MPKVQEEGKPLPKAEIAAREARVRTIHKLMQSCKTAGMVAAGQIGSTTTPEEWHGLCRGAHVDQRGRTTRCTCECHAENQHCIKCGVEGAEGETLDGSFQCLDTGACLERYKLALETDPKFDRYRRFRGYQESAAQARAETAEEERRAIEAGEKPPKQRPGKRPRPCEHGCGEMTKGGLFVMGHDAKLKGILMRAGEAGDIESILELSLRSWLPTTGRGRDRYTEADLAAADARVAEVKTEDFLAARVAERTEKAAELDGDVEAAVRAIGGVDA